MIVQPLTIEEVLKRDFSYPPCNPVWLFEGRNPRKTVAAKALLMLAAFVALLSVSSGSSLPQNNLVCVGDSITAGYGVATPWTSSLKLEGAGWKVTNAAVSGRTLSTMLSVAGVEVDQLYIPGAENIVTLLAGSNDLAFAGKTPSQVHDEQRRFCLARRERGWKVIVIQDLSRIGASDAKQEELNRLLDADHSFADAIVELPRVLTAQGSFSSRLNFLDGIHPTDFADARLIAPAVSAAVNSVSKGGK